MTEQHKIYHWNISDCNFVVKHVTVMLDFRYKLEQMNMLLKGQFTEELITLIYQKKDFRTEY